MKTTTKFVDIHSVTNPKNGEVTLFLGDEDWGPVVTGKNLAEAKKKMNEAFGLAMIANSLLDPRNVSSETVNSSKEELRKMEYTLESSL